ncbi:MAG: extracellular solute-binding protein [Albidovulum sp.]|nr:extracellular solute-binding protein [Albidovulum sp.]MDE0307708.1 extracellular solute-binding protein [Albidovulum sp.]MDE0532118.1 extracellular solute-binding protein [Albidovulum sp.]
MNKLQLLATAAAVVAAPSLASAECDIDATGEVNVITNFFETLELLANVMEECESEDLKIDVKLTTSHKEEREQAFAASTSPYDTSAVANSSITMLQAKGQLMPLNDLVEKYRDKYGIEDQMLIRFGDDIAAIAFMANAQHFFYRKDLFEKHGLDVPESYDDLLAAAKVLQSEESIDFPFGAAYGGPGNWERGNEFINILLANGGELFDPVTSEPVFDGPKGVESLELMGELLNYMSPNALSHDFGHVRQQLQQGEIAMAIQWGDQAATMDNENESIVIGNVGFAPAPAMVEGGPPAATFWWDGYVIPKNLDGDPETTFQVVMHATRAEVVESNNDITLWVRSNYVPSEYSKAVIDSVMANAPPYPMNPQSEFAHGAIGNNIGDFLGGLESAEQSLADAATDYRSAAVDAGFISE